MKQRVKKKCHCNGHQGFVVVSEVFGREYKIDSVWTNEILANERLEQLNRSDFFKKWFLKTFLINTVG